MSSNVIAFPKQTIIRSEGSWPKMDAELDTLTIRRIKTEKEFTCKTVKDAILLIGLVFQEKDVLIQKCTISRSDSGFTIKAVTFDHETLSPSSFKHTYHEQDLLEVFDGWPVGFSSDVYCQDSGEISNVSGGEFNWVVIDWEARKLALRAKYGLK